LANIPSNTFRDWKNTEVIRAQEYKQEREILRVANNDNDERIKDLELASDNLRLTDNFARPDTGPGTYPLGTSIFRVLSNTAWKDAGLVENGFVQTNRSSDGEATQVITSVGATPKVFYRRTVSGAWQAIEELALRSEAQMKKITTDSGANTIHVDTTDGDILAEALKAGAGFHTFYAVTGSKNLPPEGISIRGFVHMTSSTFGHIYSIDYRNNVWTNYHNGEYGWVGWTELTSNTQKELWSGASYMRDDQNVTPTKPLSKCRNGWVLEWSDYDPDSGANDYDFAYSYIPKSVRKSRWVYLDMPSYMSGENKTAVQMTAKLLRFTDTTISGHGDNNDGPPLNTNDVVLRRVLEW
jgi:hypothetical protein